ncbi:MAG: hypothetical protein ACI4JY_07805 [Oscillospiraceae bacterium]
MTDFKAGEPCAFFCKKQGSFTFEQSSRRFVTIFAEFAKLLCDWHGDCTRV